MHPGQDHPGYQTPKVSHTRAPANAKNRSVCFWRDVSFSVSRHDKPGDHKVWSILASGFWGTAGNKLHDICVGYYDETKNHLSFYASTQLSPPQINEIFRQLNLVLPGNFSAKQRQSDLNPCTEAPLSSNEDARVCAGTDAAKAQSLLTAFASSPLSSAFGGGSGRFYWVSVQHCVGVLLAQQGQDDPVLVAKIINDHMHFEPTELIFSAAELPAMAAACCTDSKSAEALRHTLNDRTFFHCEFPSRPGSRAEGMIDVFLGGLKVLGPHYDPQSHMLNLTDTYSFMPEHLAFIHRDIQAWRKENGYPEIEGVVRLNVEDLAVASPQTTASKVDNGKGHRGASGWMYYMAMCDVWKRDREKRKGELVHLTGISDHKPLLMASDESGEIHQIATIIEDRIDFVDGGFVLGEIRVQDIPAMTLALGVDWYSSESHLNGIQIAGIDFKISPGYLKESIRENDVFLPTSGGLWANVGNYNPDNDVLKAKEAFAYCALPAVYHAICKLRAERGMSKFPDLLTQPGREQEDRLVNESPPGKWRIKGDRQRSFEVHLERDDGLMLRYDVGNGLTANDGESEVELPVAELNPLADLLESTIVNNDAPKNPASVYWHYDPDNPQSGQHVWQIWFRESCRGVHETGDRAGLYDTQRQIVKLGDGLLFWSGDLRLIAQAVTRIEYLATELSQPNLPSQPPSETEAARQDVPGAGDWEAHTEGFADDSKDWSVRYFRPDVPGHYAVRICPNLTMADHYDVFLSEGNGYSSHEVWRNYIGTVDEAGTFVDYENESVSLDGIDCECFAILADALNRRFDNPQTIVNSARSEAAELRWMDQYWEMVFPYPEMGANTTVAISLTPIPADDDSETYLVGYSISGACRNWVSRHINNIGLYKAHTGFFYPEVRAFEPGFMRFLSQAIAQLPKSQAAEAKKLGKEIRAGDGPELVRQTDAESDGDKPTVEVEEAWTETPSSEYVLGCPDHPNRISHVESGQHFATWAKRKVIGYNDARYAFCFYAPSGKTNEVNPHLRFSLKDGERLLQLVHRDYNIYFEQQPLIKLKPTGEKDVYDIFYFCSENMFIGKLYAREAAIAFTNCELTPHYFCKVVGTCRAWISKNKPKPVKNYKIAKSEPSEPKQPDRVGFWRTVKRAIVG